MRQTLTLELPHETYEALRKVAEGMKRRPEEVAAEWLTAAVQRLTSDPLLQMSGVHASEVTDAGARHDEYIGQALLAELRGRGDG
jgi:hypothetical protein